MYLDRKHISLTTDTSEYELPQIKYLFTSLKQKIYNHDLHTSMSSIYSVTVSYDR